MSSDAASIISIALHLLSKQVVFIIALGMAFGLFAWALWEHTWIALAIAATFAVLVFLPVLFKGARYAEDRTTP